MMRRRLGKYNARKTALDGIVFASAKEARRYQALKLLEAVGEIRELELQPEYPLLVLRRGRRSEHVRVGYYRADFRYREGKDGLLVVEDVKGVKTPLYRWKRKHLLAQYGITIRET